MFARFGKPFGSLKSPRPLIVALIALYLLLAFALIGTGQAQTKEITFAWEQEITPDFGGWRLYSSPTAGGPYTKVGADISYVSQQATYTHQQQLVLPPNAETTFYFVVTAFDTAGNESGYSNEVSRTFDFLPPPVPGNFNITLVVTVGTQ